MNTILFISIIALFIFISIGWGFKTLPKEKWQILAVLPREKQIHGRWKGLNLTYYGLFSANAYTFAAFVFLILCASVKIPASIVCIFTAALLAVCLPASRLIAGFVEKKDSTLTVGGAVFAGTFVTPPVVWIINTAMGQANQHPVSLTTLMAAISIAYAYGEGLGRLACLSFGCCYGKPLKQCSPFVRKLFSGFYLIFSGKTKKIAYASGLDGEKVIPIQVVTAVLYSVTALFGTWLFLNGYFAFALLESIMVTQAWRFISEFFRADFRGDFKITPYQIMAIASILYSVCMVFIFPASKVLPNLDSGLETLWNPWMILFIELIWIITFLHTGKSVVTGAEVSFSVLKNKI